MEKAINPLLKSHEKFTFKTHESYSPEEIIAAGGTTAFAIKTGKTGKALRESIKNAPEADFSDEDWDDLLDQLKNTK